MLPPLAHPYKGGEQERAPEYDYFRINDNLMFLSFEKIRCCIDLHSG